MKLIFYKLFSSIVKLFQKRNLMWQIVFCIVTFILVSSGFDWWYFEHTRGATIQAILFPPVFLGALVPIVMFVSLVTISFFKKNKSLLNTAFATAQAGLLGLGISSLYKVFTGRSGPHGFRSVSSTLVDISHGFKFGFYRGGAFQGWPSSHTTVAFAMSSALVALYPGNDTTSKVIRWVAMIYALYVGIGVSVNIHWFSDFVAGAILGTLIGLIVGKAFYNRIKREN